MTLACNELGGCVLQLHELVLIFQKVRHMKSFLIATMISAGLIGSAAAAEVVDVGGGFAIQKLDGTNCSVLLDSKSGEPALNLKRGGASDVMVIGGPKDGCPKAIGDSKSLRVRAGQQASYVFVAVRDNGQRVNVTRKVGSTFVFRYGPKPAGAQ
jgi:hypothetical protein